MHPGASRCIPIHVFMRLDGHQGDSGLVKGVLVPDACKCKLHLEQVSVCTSHAAILAAVHVSLQFIFKFVMSMDDFSTTEAPSQGVPDDVARLLSLMETWTPLPSPSIPAGQESPDPHVDFVSASQAEELVQDALTPTVSFAQPHQEVAMSAGSAAPSIEPCANGPHAQQSPPAKKRRLSGKQSAPHYGPAPLSPSSSDGSSLAPMSQDGHDSIDDADGINEVGLVAPEDRGKYKKFHKSFPSGW